ncbi:glycosyltransferase family 2 protein [Arthrobacter sp. zg-Y877]|uniref:glycosyltransferase family 2 protein n=1 Tax=Arthrobacter sp. zg-Y877 TaxID=3049074 RepID=UPI0025A4592A|nr:glycosyltransferase family 2 protein [Arthrobacter sp. zg-Y877]MDM7989806.1 glycosyltransferase family 2 protein [Arthrobacter sp. zg-Y877]
MSVAAVVVSYNRVDLLRKCLSALENQDRRPDEIILVDNGSTDGSVAMVRREFPGVTVFETGANLGGAGGFAWGIERALAAGHDAAWLMDDDAEPLAGSLRPLVEAMENAPVRPGFVTSLVVNPEGEPNNGHLPDFSHDASQQLKATELGGMAVNSASFVGVLIDLVAAAKMPLPFADFFIWFDDAEYTRRLSRGAYGVLLPKSRISHPEKQNQTDMGGRLYYYIRNNLWLRRQDPAPRTLLQNPVRWGAGMTVLALRQGMHAQDRSLWLRSAAKGLYEGLARSPRTIWPGQLLSGSVELGR